MQRITLPLTLIFALLLTTGCSAFGGRGRSGRDIRVMTRNVYVGGDVDRIIGATDPNEVPILVLLTWQEVLANDFTARAEALADEILHEAPHFVGLQEITTFRIQDPGDMAGGGTVPAEDIVYDYLAILMDALAERGLEYDVAAVLEDTDVEMPMVVGQEPLAFQDVRMTDYDAVLVRSDVDVQEHGSQTYQALLDVDGLDLIIKRGFVWVDAEVEGEPVRFVSTHLEPVSVPQLQPLQAAQAAELVAATGDHTTIVVGDLNTAPGDATYELIRSAGFRDAWTDVRPGDPGLTCCFASDLRPGRSLETRYDLVLYRDGTGPALTARSAKRLGMQVIGRAGGIYPSDHAGVSIAFDAD